MTPDELWTVGHHYERTTGVEWWYVRRGEETLRNARRRIKRFRYESNARAEAFVLNAARKEGEG